MSSSSKSSCRVALALLLFVAALTSAANADRSRSLSSRYYDKTCPNVQRVVRSVMAHRVAGEPSMAPAILRLFFHDCFVNGCDASLLLDGNEKEAGPNASLRGFEVIDEIKSLLEHDCPATVSCADVLALASRDAVAMLGGRSWDVLLGRKDSRAANRNGAENLPSPDDNFAALAAMFEKRGLDTRDMTALSGAHTVGTASCGSYRRRVYGNVNIDPSFAAARQQTCPSTEGDHDDGGIAPFDELTPLRFDNAYYKDLVARRGLVTSDQVLYSGHGGSQDELVEMYSKDGKAFGRDFARAMVKMGNIPPPNGMPVEVRLRCNMVNNL